MEVSSDADYKDALQTYYTAIEVADTSISRRSGANLRLSLIRLILKFSADLNSINDEVQSLLNWIVRTSQLGEGHDFVKDARDLKDQLEQENSFETIQQVMRAMNGMVLADGHYDNGLSASSHWHECANGHPFFIGECGGAMQESVCIECGAPVGGAGHNLSSGNQHVSGRFQDAL